MKTRNRVLKFLIMVEAVLMVALVASVSVVALVLLELIGFSLVIFFGYRESIFPYGEQMKERKKYEFLQPLTCIVTATAAVGLLNLLMDVGLGWSIVWGIVVLILMVLLTIFSSLQATHGRWAFLRFGSNPTTARK